MRTSPLRITFRDGGLSDYAALSHHHYLPAPPATCVRVLAARAGATNETIGVLLVSMPVLNAAWREVLFPGRYRTGDRRADARRLNAEVRTISRVVVDPRYRGLGVGTSLVRRYLRAPLTPVTEAVASMGAFSGFFRAAGMRELHPPGSQRDRRLMDALASLRIDPWRLAAPGTLPASVRESALLARELRRWAQASRATRRAAQDGIESLLRRAAPVFHPPSIFVAVRTPRSSS
jgi:hypothetical protein